MDIFSDEEPDLIGLELVREFDDMVRKLYNNFNDDLDDWSKILCEYRSAIVREKVDIVLGGSYPSITPNNNATLKRTKRKAESVPVSAFVSDSESTIEGIRKESKLSPTTIPRLQFLI